MANGHYKKEPNGIPELKSVITEMKNAVGGLHIRHKSHLTVRWGNRNSWLKEEREKKKKKQNSEEKRRKTQGSVR